MQSELEQACSAILNGAIWDGFSGPDGVTKDEALEYAATLAKWFPKLWEVVEMAYYSGSYEGDMLDLMQRKATALVEGQEPTTTEGSTDRAE
jgi:hypothetical protein